MNRLLILLFCLPIVGKAQNTPLMVQGTTPDLYLNHTVAPKENYYSIGRMYNISPKEIAPFNKLQMANGLAPAQVIKIPLKEVNFLQAGTSAAGEVLIPVYYTVQQKEGFYRISIDHNKLPIPKLKEWNNISAESVDVGVPLIIGYLKVKKELSPLAGAAIAPPPAVTTEIKATPMPVENNKAAIEKVEKAKAVAIEKTVEKQASVKIIEKEKPAEKVQPVEKENVITEEPVKKEISKELIKETPKIIEKVKPVETAREMIKTTGKTFGGGLFKPDYEKQVKSGSVVKETGAAAMFKSNSGWEDGKYYCLYNNAFPGTIIKITNNVTGKSAFAKVLDIMPDIQQNQDVIIRLSNAAAQELGVTDVRFDCTISYSK
ncbi:MAG: LysM peptidoglycan-binding domain-containing protein [Sphingobacteriales bacterium]|nr:LysM peptidoglycan-binding domain-containing protein [Sphingobacteriales bacterium]